MTYGAVVTDPRQRALVRLQRAALAEAERVLPLVAAYVGDVGVADLIGPGRRRDLVEARGLAMLLMSAVCWPTAGGNRPLPLIAIGRIVHRDHSTVLSALRVMGRALAVRPETGHMLRELQALVERAEARR